MDGIIVINNTFTKLRLKFLKIIIIRMIQMEKFFFYHLLITFTNSLGNHSKVLAICQGRKNIV